MCFHVFSMQFVGLPNVSPKTKYCFPFPVSSVCVAQWVIEESTVIKSWFDIKVLCLHRLFLTWRSPLALCLRATPQSAAHSVTLSLTPVKLGLWYRMMMMMMMNIPPSSPSPRAPWMSSWQPVLRTRGTQPGLGWRLNAAPAPTHTLSRMLWFFNSCVCTWGQGSDPPTVRT